MILHIHETLSGYLISAPRRRFAPAFQARAEAELYRAWLAWFFETRTEITADQERQGAETVREFLAEFAECDLGVVMEAHEMLKGLLQWDSQRVMCDSGGGL